MASAGLSSALVVAKVAISQIAMADPKYRTRAGLMIVNNALGVGPRLGTTHDLEEAADEGVVGHEFVFECDLGDEIAVLVDEGIGQALDLAVTKKSVGPRQHPAGAFDVTVGDLAADPDPGPVGERSGASARERRGPVPPGVASESGVASTAFRRKYATGSAGKPTGRTRTCCSCPVRRWPAWAWWR